MLVGWQRQGGKGGEANPSGVRDYLRGRRGLRLRSDLFFLRRRSHIVATAAVKTVIPTRAILKRRVLSGEVTVTGTERDASPPSKLISQPMLYSWAGADPHQQVKSGDCDPSGRYVSEI